MPSTPDSQANIGTPSKNTVDQWKQSKNPAGVDAPTPEKTPDLTDDLVRQAREWQVLNIQSKRGRNSTFLTNPTDMTKPPTKKGGQ